MTHCNITESYCSIVESEEFQVLREIAHAQRGRSLRNLSGSKIMEKAEELAQERRKNTQKRLEEYRQDLKRREEQLFYETLDALLNGREENEVAETITKDKKRQKLREEITSLEWESKSVTSRDLEDFLTEYEKKGYIDREGWKIKITPRGARLLGRGLLRKIMENLTKKGVGAHRLEETGYGPWLSRFSRPYEIGDTYERINVEKTFFKTLEKGRRIDQLKIEDFEVYEALHQTKMNVGILVDESGSMSYRKKVDAAIETALALSELMRTNYPQDTLRIFIFSEHVKEIPPWDIPNIQVPMRCTDIRAGMRAYRRAVAREDGDKQAYLITDTEPNFQDGRYVGFSRAALGVLGEASHYRQKDITLNIIMLDRTYHLREFASMAAKKNVGRVVFANPENLGESIIEDYLISKREKLYV